MENGGDADPRAEMLRVGSNRQHRLRGGAEQQVIDHRLVVEGDLAQFGRQGEDDMEIPYGQQVGFARSEPGARGCTLTLGAVPVAAGVVGDASMPALIAGLDMASECGGAAGLDRRHHLELVEAEMPGMVCPIGRASGAEDIGDLERGQHGFSRRASRV